MPIIYISYTIYIHEVVEILFITIFYFFMREHINSNE